MNLPGVARVLGHGTPEGSCLSKPSFVWAPLHVVLGMSKYGRRLVRVSRHAGLWWSINMSLSR